MLAPFYHNASAPVRSSEYYKIVDLHRSSNRAATRGSVTGYGSLIVYMKTTLELPGALCRRAKSAAAQRGIPFRELVSEALAEKLAVHGAGEKPWMKLFGGQRALRKESARIDRLIEDEFERPPWRTAIPNWSPSSRRQVSWRFP